MSDSSTPDVPPKAPLGAAASIEQDLEDAARDLAEQERLRRRLTSAQTARADAVAETATARAALEDEQADVAALESFSPTRIWAAVRGVRDIDLDRERGEARAAEYAVARAEARVAEANADVRRVEQQLGELGDPEARRVRAWEAKEGYLVRTGAPAGAALSEISGRLGELASQGTELSEAQVAAHSSLKHLDEAVTLLQKASSWAGWDTWGGGGMLTDAMKYDRMDAATTALERAQRHVAHLRSELADVDVRSDAQVVVSDGLRTFDVWFDNIFSDWAVKNRINDALDSALDTRGAVQDVAVALSERLQAVSDEAAALQTRRQDLLA